MDAFTRRDRRQFHSGPPAPRGSTASLLLLSLLLLFLSSCAHYQSRPLSPAQVASDFDQRTLTDEALRGFIETHTVSPLPSWPLAEWDFTNLTLAAFYYHPDLDAARAEWATVRAGEVTAGQRPNPTVGVTPSYNTTRSIPTPWMVNFTVDIPIETAGKRGYRVAQAQHLSEAARLNIASVAWAVRARLRQNLVNFYGAQETVELLRRQVGTLEDWVRLLESRWQAGAASPFEVTQARLELDRTRLKLHDAERLRDEARVQVASAVGLPVSALRGTSLSFVGLTAPPPDLSELAVRRQALLNRADILGALAAYAASESALQLEIAKQYPDVRLSPGYKYDQGENEWALGLSLDLPLLNQNQGPIAEAEARRAQAAAQFQILQAQVVAELDRGSAVYRAALAKVETAEKLLVNQRTQREIAQARWSAGDISKLELSGIDLEVDLMRLARLEAVVQAQQALGALEHALQRPILHTPPLWGQVAEGRVARKEPNHE